MKKKKIGKTIASIGKIAIRILEGAVVSRIENEKIKEGIKTLLSPVKGSLIVLSDNDPNDKEQIEKVWLEFLRSQELVNYTEIQIYDLIEKIKIDSVREGLKNLVMPALRTLQALINVNPNNREEIEKIWLEFIRNEDLRNFLLVEVEKLINKVEHEQLREALELLVVPLIKTLSSLVDTDLNDKEQIEEIWIKFSKSQGLAFFALKNVKIWLNNLGADELIVETVALFLENILEEII